MNADELTGASGEVSYMEESVNSQQIRSEFLRNKQHYIDLKGDRCIYCGAKMKEFHHIVPVHMGGDNRESNIVPLCQECHDKAHSRRTGERRADWGRKRKERPENFDEVVNMYLDCKISMKKALELTGLSRGTFYRMLGDWADERGDKRKHRDNGIVYPKNRLRKGETHE